MDLLAGLSNSFNIPKNSSLLAIPIPGEETLINSPSMRNRRRPLRAWEIPQRLRVPSGRGNEQSGSRESLLQVEDEVGGAGVEPTA